MRPAFSGGELIAINPCSFDESLKGRVVVTWRAGSESNVMHRVIGFRYGSHGIDGLILKGDANRERDPYVTTLAEFVGCVEKLSP
jgi:hypothetical protein